MVKAAPKKPFVYLFTGDEFLRRSKIEALIRELIPEELKTTNLIHLYSDDLDWAELLKQASTSSLLGGTQIFWISKIEQLKKTNWTLFEQYCQKLSSDSLFIFEADDLPATHALTKLVSVYGKHVYLSEQEKGSGFEAIKAKLRKFDKKMSSEAWQVLEDRLGGSLRFMDLAVDQTILYVEGAVIEASDIEKITKEFLQYDPFELTEAIAQKNMVRAIKIFNFFYELSDDLTSIVGLIHWQLKRIWQAKKILERGGGKEDILKILRISPYRLGAFLAQSKQFDLPRLEKLLGELWQIDWNSKTGQLDAKIALETLLAQVA